MKKHTILKPATAAAKALVLLSAALGAASLAGCGMNSAGSKVIPPATITGASFRGTVTGGQQPVAGVTLQMYQAGSGSYGAAAKPLFPAGSVQTTPSGNFTFPSYTCDAGSQLYLVGTGGTPIGGSPNPNLALMAGLGVCNGTGVNSFIDMNELTTVATVWALSGFMTSPTNLGAPTSNITGLNNAFAAINKVVTLTNGTVSGPALPIGATLPIAEINALADILQNCVNSAGGQASDTTDGLTNGTPCGKLFYLTPNSGGVAPTDTITAALNIAQHPAVNTTKLNALQSSSPAFSPSLSVNAPPVSWTIAINYVGGGLSTPQSIATDATGNVWVTNKGNQSVTKLSNSGAASSGTTGYTAGSLNLPYGIAIDSSGNAWITNSGNSTITRLSADGTTGTVYSGNGLTTPRGIAIDGSGDVWVANSASTTVSAFTSAGGVLTGSPYSGGGISSPSSIAINPK